MRLPDSERRKRRSVEARGDAPACRVAGSHTHIRPTPWRSAAARGLLAPRTVLHVCLLALVAAVAASIGVATADREHGLVVPAGIGLGAGLVSAAIARALELPSILPISLGALVCPAPWALGGAAVIGLSLRWLLAPRTGGPP